MASIPKSFQDYDEDDPLNDQRKKRWDYWAALKQVRQEYMSILDTSSNQFDAYEFEDYLENNYGVKMNMVNGNITDGYKIMDEKKYLLFLLKFQ
jgi:hypothetical protein